MGVGDWGDGGGRWVCDRDMFKIVDNVMKAVRACNAFTYLILKSGIESTNLNACKHKICISVPLP